MDMAVYTLEQRWKTGPAIDLKKMPILAKKKKIIFSDEAHFELGGYVNKENCRVWGTDNPNAYIEKPKHLKRASWKSASELMSFVLLWAAIWHRLTIIF